MWLTGISLLAFHHIILLQAGEIGNSLVTCAACQTLQAQIDNWSCDINCKVANGNNEDLVTFGLINQLIQEVKRLNDTVQRQQERFEKLELSNCAFSARGPDMETVQTLTNTALVFENVDLNICGCYDNSTGIFTATVNGTYQFMVTIRGNRKYGPIYIKKNGDIVCQSWVVNEFIVVGSCTVILELVMGDSVWVAGTDDDPASITGDFRHFSGHLIHSN